MHQLENGFTRIANTILDELSKTKISANEFRMVIWIMRNSYGFRRKTTSSITARELSKELDMSPSSSIHALMKLKQIGLVGQNDNLEIFINKNNISSDQPIGQSEKKVTNPLVIVTNPLVKSDQPIGHPNTFNLKERKKLLKKEQNTGFDEFYKAYPRKVAKTKALSAWLKHKPNLDLCLKALSWQTKQDRWLRDNGEYIPHPATWLNQHRWEDENISTDIAGQLKVKPIELTETDKLIELTRKYKEFKAQEKANGIQ